MRAVDYIKKLSDEHRRARKKWLIAVFYCIATMSVFAGLYMASMGANIDLSTKYDDLQYRYGIAVALLSEHIESDEQNITLPKKVRNDEYEQDAFLNVNCDDTKPYRDFMIITKDNQSYSLSFEQWCSFWLTLE